MLGPITVGVGDCGYEGQVGFLTEMSDIQRLMLCTGSLEEGLYCSDCLISDYGRCSRNSLN